MQDRRGGVSRRYLPTRRDGPRVPGILPRGPLLILHFAEGGSHILASVLAYLSDLSIYRLLQAGRRDMYIDLTFPPVLLIFNLPSSVSALHEGMLV